MQTAAGWILLHPLAASKCYDAQATVTRFCVCWQEATILWRASLLPVLKYDVTRNQSHYEKIEKMIHNEFH